MQCLDCGCISFIKYFKREFKTIVDPQKIYHYSITLKTVGLSTMEHERSFYFLVYKKAVGSNGVGSSKYVLFCYADERKVCNDMKVCK